jgi:hypothetical protein
VTLVKVCKSLGKLEEAWNEKYQKEEDEFEEELRGLATYKVGEQGRAAGYDDGTTQFTNS